MPRSPAAPPPTRDDARHQILRSARSCFLRDGLRVTTMEAVAKASGTSRQTVYKFFPNRRALIEAAVAERISELADDILAESKQDGTLTDVFVWRCSAVVVAIREDDELAVLMGDGSPLTLHQALWQPSVRQRGLTDWRPWLRDARREGLIRGDVTDEDVYEWLQTVLTSIILRPDPDPEHQRVLIEAFLVESMRPRPE